MRGWPTRTATSCASDLRWRRGKPRARYDQCTGRMHILTAIILRCSEQGATKGLKDGIAGYIHDDGPYGRARHVPDRVVGQGSSRSLTDRPVGCRPGSQHVAAVVEGP